MAKLRVLAALLGLLVASALAVGGASATLWLKSGQSLLTAETISMHGIVTLHNTFFGMALEARCSLLLSVLEEEAGVKYLIPLTESLTGVEKDLLRCEPVAGCKNPVLHMDNLPWRAEVGSKERIFEDGKGAPGWMLLCSEPTIEVLCAREMLFQFTGNGVNGAKFEFTKAGTEVTCSDGGVGWMTGSLEVLGLAIS